MRGLNETSMAEDCWLELDKKLSALLTKNGDAAARNMIEQSQETEASWAILKKIEGMMTGHFSFDKDVSAALRFAKEHDEYAYYYLVVAGAWLGAFGLKKDCEFAKKIMLENGITF